MPDVTDLTTFRERRQRERDPGRRDAVKITPVERGGHRESAECHRMRRDGRTIARVESI